MTLQRDRYIQWCTASPDSKLTTLSQYLFPTDIQHSWKPRIEWYHMSLWTSTYLRTRPNLARVERLKWQINWSQTSEAWSISIPKVRIIVLVGEKICRWITPFQVFSEPLSTDLWESLLRLWNRRFSGQCCVQSLVRAIQTWPEKWNHVTGGREFGFVIYKWIPLFYTGSGNETRKHHEIDLELVLLRGRVCGDVIRIISETDLKHSGRCTKRHSLSV